MSLDDLLARQEGKTLEFKRDLSSPENFLKTLTAFANSAGGTVLIGVEDVSRRIRGVADVLKEEERVANLVTDGVFPRLMPEIEILSHRKFQVLAVVVHPSSMRPHHLVKQGPESGVYVRVGSTNRRADRSLIAELKREARLESFDEQALPGRDSEALDFRVASECFAAVKKLKQADLDTLKLTVPHQGRRTASVGGMLLFGKDRFRDFPDAFVQAGVFLGVDKTQIEDSREFREPLPELIEPVLRFITRQLRHGIEIKGARNTPKSEIPPLALREALINALAHADYSQMGAPTRVAIFDDRIEIENPGLLPFGLTPEDAFGGVSKIRNRVIARVFKELGYIEQWGSGLQRMRQACAGMGLPGPSLEELGGRVRLTLSRIPEAPPTFGEPGDRKVLEALEKHGALSSVKLAELAGLSARAIRTRMNKLVAKGLVVAQGTSLKDPKRVYVLRSRNFV